MHGDFVSWGYVAARGLHGVGWIVGPARVRVRCCSTAETSCEARDRRRSRWSSPCSARSRSRVRRRRPRRARRRRCRARRGRRRRGDRRAGRPPRAGTCRSRPTSTTAYDAAARARRRPTPRTRSPPGARYASAARARHARRCGRRTPTTCADGERRDRASCASRRSRGRASRPAPTPAPARRGTPPSSPATTARAAAPRRSPRSASPAGSSAIGCCCAARPAGRAAAVLARRGDRRVGLVGWVIGLTTPEPRSLVSRPHGQEPRWSDHRPARVRARRPARRGGDRARRGRQGRQVRRGGADRSARRRRRRASAGSRSRASPTWAPRHRRASSCRCSTATTRRSPSAPRRCSRSRAPPPRARCARRSARGPIAARRVMAQLLLRRGTQPAIDAVLDQLADGEFGEQALQLVRAELDQRQRASSANQVEKSAVERASEANRELGKAWTRAQKAAADAGRPRRRRRRRPRRRTAQRPARRPRADPMRDPEVAQGMAELGALLRLIGYLARPSTQSLLLKYADAERAAPDPARRDRRPAPHRRARARRRAPRRSIEALIEFADGDDLAVAQSAVDTLRGARIPESLAKPFAGAREVARTRRRRSSRWSACPPAAAPRRSRRSSRRSAATIRPRATPRPAASRRRPRRCCRVTRALLADDRRAESRAATPACSARTAATSRTRRSTSSSSACASTWTLHFKGKATADQIVLERVLAELIADVAPAHPRRAAVRARAAPAQAGQGRRGVRQPEAAAPLARRYRRRHRRRAALLPRAALARGRRRGPDPHDAHRRSGVRAVRAARREGLSRSRSSSHARRTSPTRRSTRSASASSSRGDGANEELGAELLQGIIDERPRSKLAKAAKNKLKLTGHGDDD